MGEKTAVFDTSSKERIHADKIIVPHHVEGELESRNVPTGLVDEVERTEVSPNSMCVNDVIQKDIEKAASARDRDVVKNLQRAQKQRSEQNRQEMLRRAYDSLNHRQKEKIGGKSWQGMKSGAKTDCSVLKLGEKHGEIVSEDGNLLDLCEEKEGLKCRSLRDR